MIKLGKNHRLQIEDPATAGTFVTIGGEQKLAFNSAPNPIDTSSKDDGNYATESFGQQKVSLTISGKAKTPDAGLAQLDTLAKSGGSALMQIIDTVSDTEVFECELSVGGRQVDFDNQQAVNYSFNLSLAAAPTIDSLFG